MTTKISVTNYNLEELSYWTKAMLEKRTVYELKQILKPFVKVTGKKKQELVALALEITKEFREARKSSPLDFIYEYALLRMEEVGAKELSEELWDKLSEKYSENTAFNRGYELAKMLEASGQERAKETATKLRELIAPLKLRQKKAYDERVNKAAHLIEHAEVVDDGVVESLCTIARQVLSDPERATRDLLIITLALVTGRRTSEIVLGQLEEFVVDDQPEFDQCVFTGQLKSKVDEPYVIRVLAPAKVVLRAWVCFKERFSSGLPTDPDEINAKLATPLRRTLLKYGIKVNVHYLRHIYAAFLAKTVPAGYRLVNYYVASNLYPILPGDPISSVVNSYIATEVSPKSCEELKGLLGIREVN